MNKVLFGDIEMELEGQDVIKVGENARPFKAIKGDMSEFEFNGTVNRKTLISVVPSLDTGVCEFQTKKFYDELKKLENVDFITISCDLPFAQSRFCKTAVSEDMVTLSDYRDHNFGLTYGLLLKPLKLLTRAIIIIDENNVVTYVEVCAQVKSHPNYDSALNALK